MKKRSGFVSNSSSSSFIITNKTNSILTLVDFVKENPNLVQAFNDSYGYKYTQAQMVDDAVKRQQKFSSGEQEATYGDEEGGVLGCVFDYILRGGGESASFKWRFNRHRR